MRLKVARHEEGRELLWVNGLGEDLEVVAIACGGVERGECHLKVDHSDIATSASH